MVDIGAIFQGRLLHTPQFERLKRPSRQCLDFSFLIFLFLSNFALIVHFVSLALFHVGCRFEVRVAQHGHGV